MLYMFHNLSAKSVRSLKSGWFASSGETTPRSSKSSILIWWNGINPPDSQDDVVFKNNQYYRVGVEYTPNAIDIRRFLNRWTYRFGVYYNDYYMRINGHKINDVGLSVGVGIPIKMQGFSSVNLGLTWGCRGTTATGMIGTRQFRMVRENYIKVSIGLSLFGEDDWFKRFKYQ